MSVVYDDPEMTSLSEGLRILPTVPHPFLRIRYTLSLKEFHTDPVFSRLVRHEKNGTVRLTFPSACASVTNIRMNRTCRMVTYYRDKKSRCISRTTKISYCPLTSMYHVVLNSNGRGVRGAGTFRPTWNVYTYEKE